MGPKVTDEYTAAPDGVVVATAVNSEPVPMVNVIAPASLPEGYTFEAQIGERTFTATVPAGGVKEGQSFLTVLPPEGNTLRSNKVTGRWKDSLCDFCSFGCCHPHLCCAIFFPQLLMGQVMQRMKLTWLGESGKPESRTRNSFKIVLGIYLAYEALLLLLDLSFPPKNDGTYSALNALKTVVSASFFFYTIFALMQTRGSIRKEFNIPEEQCVGCEDLCCAVWCGCCTVTQLARHTAEYDTYRGVCCSETGLPPHVVVV